MTITDLIALGVDSDKMTEIFSLPTPDNTVLLTITFTEDLIENINSSNGIWIKNQVDPPFNMDKHPVKLVRFSYKKTIETLKLPEHE